MYTIIQIREWGVVNVGQWFISIKLRQNADTPDEMTPIIEFKTR
jgi:hypothetical protein